MELAWKEGFARCEEHSPSGFSLPIFFLLTVWLDLWLLNSAAQAAQRESVHETDRISFHTHETHTWAPQKF